MREEPAPSQLQGPIPAEIKNDRLYRVIVDVAATAGVRQMLEIGSSSGTGSTEAFVTGSLRNPQRPVLHCLEVSRPRFAALAERYKHLDFVKCYNLSSVPLERFPTADAVMSFYRSRRSRLRKYPLEQVLDWLRQDKEYLEQSGL